MKNLCLTLLLLVSINCFSQNNRSSTPTDYLNNIIWNQVFSNFDVKVPLFIVTPYVSVFGNFSYIDNDVFIKNSLKTDDIFSTFGLIQKEFSRNLNISFFDYLPKDSVLLLKALYKNRLLYSFSFHKTDSFLTLEYKLPDNAIAEKVIFNNNGDLVKQIRNHSVSSTTTSIANSDTVKRILTDNNLDDFSTLEEIRIKNGIVCDAKIFKLDKNTKKEKEIRNHLYKYDPEGRLKTILNLNKKNIAADSLVYYYKSDTLIGIYHHRIKENPNRVIYTYSNGNLSQKNIIRDEFSLEMNFKYWNNKISKMTFFTKGEENREIFEFEYNVGGKLISVIQKTSSDAKKEDFKRQFSFIYSNSNLVGIKIIHKNGVIEKEIRYEYDYK